MNETTELIMKQLNSKKVHAETHEVGGGDEIDVTKLKNIEDYVTIDGDFAGTWNGVEMTSVEPGLSSAFNALKADTALSPEQFTGTDFQKLQSALDYAISNDRAVRLTRMYDITGAGSLSINKANGSWDTDRRMLYIFGSGGGIRKDDAGKMFTAPYQKIGDITVEQLRYQGVVGSGMIIWDCDKLIRVNESHCKYINVDTIASAPNQYFQSMSFTHCHITGGNGWAFEFRESYDTTLHFFLMEGRENGVRNTVGLAAVQNRILRISGMMEGLTGTPVRLGSCYGTSFNDLYIESCANANGGYIDFLTLDTYNQYGLTFKNCGFFLTAAQISANYPAIMHGSIFEGSVSGVTSDGNVCNGVLHQVKNTGTIGYISARGDAPATAIMPTNRAGRYIQISHPKVTVGTYSTYTQWGASTKQSVTMAISLTANQVKQYDYVFDIPGLADDVFSVTLTNSLNISVVGIEVGSNKMTVTFLNRAATTQTSNATLTCFKIFNT